jgi:hypothetical protein
VARLTFTFYKDDKEGAWGGTSRHTEQYGQPGVDVFESRPIEGGRRARGASNGDNKDKSRCEVDQVTIILALYAGRLLNNRMWL